MRHAGPPAVPISCDPKPVSGICAAPGGVTLGTVQESLAFIARHGYALLFGWVAAEQLGAPLPAVPILIAAGVLSATGQMSLAMSVGVGVVAWLVGDTDR